jgi:hypothetical protein
LTGWLLNDTVTSLLAFLTMIIIPAFDEFRVRTKTTIEFISLWQKQQQGRERKGWEGKERKREGRECQGKEEEGREGKGREEGKRREEKGRYRIIAPGFASAIPHCFLIDNFD